MSKILAAPLALMVALTLAACGGDAPPSDPSATPPANTAPATDPATPAAPATPAN